jgi:DNA-binding response OmpR family regulator
MMQRRVLVVDDDLDIRELICEYFRGRGWEATGVGSVGEGMEALQETLVGVVVDQRLPDRDGSVLVREAARRGLAVLAITAFPTIEEALELLEAGASTLLPKPFRLKELMERMEFAILRRQQEKEQHRKLQALELLESMMLAESESQISALEQQLLELAEEMPPSWAAAILQARQRVGEC